jgi:hypothetical protein
MAIAGTCLDGNHPQLESLDAESGKVMMYASI